MIGIHAAYVFARVTPLAALLLTGCVTLFDSRYPSAEGWRYAWVHKVGTAEEVAKVTLKHCLVSAPEAIGKFAEVGFRNGSGSRSIAVPLPVGVQLNSGDTVYVNIETCSLKLAATRAVLSPPDPGVARGSTAVGRAGLSG